MDLLSVQPLWCRALSLQQQSVLMLAARGPDGIAKDHPVKDVQRAYRGTVLVAAKYGRELAIGERADSFMSLDLIGDTDSWNLVVSRFLYTIDTLPHHFVTHLLHGAEIIGYKHPNDFMRLQWQQLYFAGVEDMHMNVETSAQMDARLSDWNQELWDN